MKIAVVAANGRVAQKVIKEALARGLEVTAEFLSLAKAQGKELEELRKRNDVQWTFISPAGDFQSDVPVLGSTFLQGKNYS